MSKRVCVIDLPGMSRDLLNHVPANSRLGKWIANNRVAGLTPTWPAVTCSVQATLTTGTSPAKHGIIANGIATFRSPQDQGLIDASNFPEFRREVSFWEQSNQLIEVPRFWNGKCKTALLFFQNAMPGFVDPLKPAADIVITPKPEHGPDGKIASLLWTEPRDLQMKVFEKLGPFPLMNYWGPLANIKSSQWIARAAAHVWREQQPQLQLVYVPHMDYDLQRFGPSSPQARQAVIDLAEALDPLFDSIDGEIVVLSEYAMRKVSHAIPLNRIFADAGLLRTREGNLIDYGRSAAFAMCDHQIAHVYSSEDVRSIVQGTGARIIQPERHRRSGDLMLEAPADAWFDYRWWDRAEDAPSFATQVDIHRKPGYDPLELFFDPATKGITQDASRVRGSHGIVTPGEAVFISSKQSRDVIGAAEVAGMIQQLLES